jgi:hypothetical protein
MREAVAERENRLVAEVGLCIETARDDLLNRLGWNPGGLVGTRVGCAGGVVSIPDAGRFNVRRTDDSVLVAETSIDDSDTLRTIPLNCESALSCNLLFEV